MRVAHIITGLSTGGAENALYNLLSSGLTERFENHIISLSNEGTLGPQIQALRVPVTPLNMRTGIPSLSGLMKLGEAVRLFQPTLIQGWMYHGNLAATMARFFLSDRPLLAWNIRHSLYDLNHEKLLTQQVIRANNFLSSAPDTLLYNSQLSREQHENFGFSPNKGLVIPNGIDVQRFSFSPAIRQNVRFELGIPANAQVVGHVARFHPMKDHPAFLHAALDLASIYPELHFLLCGRDVSMANKLFRTSIPNHIRDRFHILGERNDVPDLMNAMDVFCQSSWSEAFPNVLGEAMATEVPCVSTDVGDSRHIVGDTGIVVPPRNKDALVDGIKRLLSMPLDDRRKLGAKARARIEDQYALKEIVGRYSSLYRTLLSRKRAA